MPTIPILLGLIAALSWGISGFGGGIAAKRTNAYGAAIGSHIGGLLFMVGVALVMNETIPSIRDWLLSVVSGIGSGVGILLLYRALAEGKMSIGAPVSAVVAAAIPVIVGGFMQGLPSIATLSGFTLALIAVWLLASEDGIVRPSLKALGIPFWSGIAFGLFLVLIAQASQQATFWPIVGARIGSVSSLLIFSIIARKNWRPAHKYWGPLAFVGMIDVAGTICYAIATQIGRLDVTAILGSLYPGATVLLAWVFLKEKVSRIQVIGILLALSAITLLTL